MLNGSWLSWPVTHGPCCLDRVHLSAYIVLAHDYMPTRMSNYVLAGCGQFDFRMSKRDNMDLWGEAECICFPSFPSFQAFMDVAGHHILTLPSWSSSRAACCSGGCIRCIGLSSS